MLTVLATVIGFGSLAGCGTPAAPPASAGPSAEGQAFLLATEPAAAKGVKEARASAKDADEVTLVGRIGGDAKPWIEGQAAFLVVDSALKPCGADEGCPTPWDYCCDADQLPNNKAIVKFVDGSGKTVATDARQLLGLKELQTVVVHGRAQRDEAGNLTVLADGVFVRN
ncbi:MAG: hypothetical protein SFU86_16370 [Pirellulaceae bacterium]|nr:hypothetical protein [Pirellulaceae bacterium]